MRPGPELSKQGLTNNTKKDTFGDLKNFGLTSKNDQIKDFFKKSITKQRQQNDQKINTQKDCSESEI